MSNIIKALIENSHSENTLQNLYGISPDEHIDCVFVAPSWQVEKIFDTEQTDVAFLYQDRFSKAFKIQNGDKQYLYIQLQVGASNIIDFCLSCYNMNCDNFVFIGSVGALVPEMNVGDIVVPESAISGNGATVYLHDRLDGSNMFEKTYSSPELNAKIRTICEQVNIPVTCAVPISMDSLMCEYQHLQEFRDMGAQLVEMEVATFFKALEIIGKQASAVLVISDNSAAGQHLIGQPAEQLAKYHGARGRIKDILLRI